MDVENCWGASHLDFPARRVSLSVQYSALLHTPRFLIDVFLGLLARILRFGGWTMFDPTNPPQSPLERRQLEA